MTTRDRFLGCLLGLAVGDAVGTTLEFKPRGSFRLITDMTGGGPFGLAPGQWTDDTSMALCLASSLVERGEFDPADQMARYVRWHDEGYWSSNGHCFDIGNATAAAVCGQIAGAFYGAVGIPQRWLDTLAMREEIGELASRLFARSGLVGGWTRRSRTGSMRRRRSCRHSGGE